MTAEVALKWGMIGKPEDLPMLLEKMRTTSTGTSESVDATPSACLVPLSECSRDSDPENSPLIVDQLCMASTSNGGQQSGE